MSRRPGARFDPDVHHRREVKTAIVKDMVRIRHEQAARADQAWNYLMTHGKAYTGDLIRDLGFTMSQAYTILKKFEANGALTSWLEHAPRSGLGRRYYKIKCDQCDGEGVFYIDKVSQPCICMEDQT